MAHSESLNVEQTMANIINNDDIYNGIVKFQARVRGASVRDQFKIAKPTEAPPIYEQVGNCATGPKAKNRNPPSSFTFDPVKKPMRYDNRSYETNFHGDSYSYDPYDADRKHRSQIIINNTPFRIRPNLDAERQRFEEDQIRGELEREQKLRQWFHKEQQIDPVQADKFDADDYLPPKNQNKVDLSGIMEDIFQKQLTRQPAPFVPARYVDPKFVIAGEQILNKLDLSSSLDEKYVRLEHLERSNRLIDAKRRLDNLNDISNNDLQEIRSKMEASRQNEINEFNDRNTEILTKAERLREYDERMRQIQNERTQAELDRWRQRQLSEIQGNKERLVVELETLRRDQEYKRQERMAIQELLKTKQKDAAQLISVRKNWMNQEEENEKRFEKQIDGELEKLVALNLEEKQWIDEQRKEVERMNQMLLIQKEMGRKEEGEWEREKDKLEGQLEMLRKAAKRSEEEMDNLHKENQDRRKTKLKAFEAKVEALKQVRETSTLDAETHNKFLNDRNISEALLETQKETSKSRKIEEFNHLRRLAFKSNILDRYREVLCNEIASCTDQSRLTYLKETYDNTITLEMVGVPENLDDTVVPPVAYWNEEDQRPVGSVPPLPMDHNQKHRKLDSPEVKRPPPLPVVGVAHFGMNRPYTMSMFETPAPPPQPGERVQPGPQPSVVHRPQSASRALEGLIVAGEGGFRFLDSFDEPSAIVHPLQPIVPSEIEVPPPPLLSDTRAVLNHVQSVIKDNLNRLEYSGGLHTPTATRTIAFDSPVQANPSTPQRKNDFWPVPLQIPQQRSYGAVRADVGTYPNDLQHEQAPTQSSHDTAATKIQSTFRGHLTRARSPKTSPKASPKKETRTVHTASRLSDTPTMQGELGRFATFKELFKGSRSPAMAKLCSVMTSDHEHDNVVLRGLCVGEFGNLSGPPAGLAALYASVALREGRMQPADAVHRTVAVAEHAFQSQSTRALSTGALNVAPKEHQKATPSSGVSFSNNLMRDSTPPTKQLSVRQNKQKDATVSEEAFTNMFRLMLASETSERQILKSQEESEIHRLVQRETVAMVELYMKQPISKVYPGQTLDPLPDEDETARTVPVQPKELSLKDSKPPAMTEHAPKPIPHGIPSAPLKPAHHRESTSSGDEPVYRADSQILPETPLEKSLSTASQETPIYRVESQRTNNSRKPSEISNAQDMPIYRVGSSFQKNDNADRNPSKEGKEKAALRIQTSFRGHRSRKELTRRKASRQQQIDKLEARDDAAMIIQASFRGHLHRKKRITKEARQLEEDKNRERQQELRENEAQEERLEKERRDKQKQEQEKVEKQRLDRERLAKEKLENEKLDKERAAKAALEREISEKQKVEKERIALERLELERAARERHEKERLAKERDDKEKAEREKSNKEKSDKEKADKEKLDKERAERERSDATKTGKETETPQRESKRTEVEHRKHEEKAPLDRGPSMREAEDKELREREAQERGERDRPQFDLLEREKSETERRAQIRTGDGLLLHAHAERVQAAAPAPLPRRVASPDSFQDNVQQGATPPRTPSRSTDIDPEADARGLALALQNAALLQQKEQNEKEIASLRRELDQLKVKQKETNGYEDAPSALVYTSADQLQPGTADPTLAQRCIENDAATLIQSMWRGAQTRSQLMDSRLDMEIDKVSNIILSENHQRKDQLKKEEESLIRNLEVARTRQEEVNILLGHRLKLQEEERKLQSKLNSLTSAIDDRNVLPAIQRASSFEKRMPPPKRAGATHTATAVQSTNREQHDRSVAKLYSQDLAGVGKRTPPARRQFAPSPGVPFAPSPSLPLPTTISQPMGLSFSSGLSPANPTPHSAPAGNESFEPGFHDSLYEVMSGVAARNAIQDMRARAEMLAKHPSVLRQPPLQPSGPKRRAK